MRTVRGHSGAIVYNPARHKEICDEYRDISDEKWVIAVKFFREIGVWPDHLGPPPVKADAAPLWTCWRHTASPKPVGDRHELDIDIAENHAGKTVERLAKGVPRRWKFYMSEQN
jgi:hypothetical protein